MWTEGDIERFDRARLVEEDDYYPFDMADVVRFVENRDFNGNHVSCCAN